MTWDRLRGSYDAVAGKYEAAFLDELEAKPRDRELLADFAASVGDPVAEIGCGPGQVGAFVRDRGRRVLGLDLSPQMARRAAGRLDAALAADMRALPVGTASLGGLVAFYAVIHLRRQELAGALVEFHRALRPDGRVLLSVHEGTGELADDRFLDEPVPFVATMFGLDELVRALDGAGFEILRAERRPPYAAEHPTVRLYVEAIKPGIG